MSTDQKERWMQINEKNLAVLDKLSSEIPKEKNHIDKLIVRIKLIQEELQSC